MAIYLCLLIPVLNVLVLYFFFRHKTLWWEFAIPVVASIIFIFLGKFVAIKALTDDTQYLGGYVTKLEYYEPWNEYIHRTCSYKCGKSTCYRDCSYVRYHSAEWVAVTTVGNFYISKEKYNYWLYKKLHVDKPTFKDMNRNYHTIDGNMYYGLWNKEDETIIPVTVEDVYENRPKASKSIYHFQELDSIDIKLYKPFDYPAIDDNNYQNCLLGSKDNFAERNLALLNSKLGGKKHVRVFILVFENKTIDAGHVQERYWEGSNKNEFVITIGVDEQNKVNWVYDFSWTEVEETKIEIEDFILKQEKLDLTKVVDFTYKEIEQKWIPRNFHQFDILTIQPSMTAIFWILILTIAINVGISYWIIKNEFDDQASY